MRVRDIAIESHTSASSVMRFVRKIGFSSFTEFRTHFSSPKLEATNLFKGLEVLQKENFPPDLEYRIKQVVEQILKCENLIFFGMGASGSICEYAARRFATIGFNSFALIDVTYPIIAKLRNTSDNVLITLSVSGKTNEVVELVNTFKNQADFTTIAITSDPQSTVAKLSDYILDYRVDIRRIHKHEDLTSQIPCIFLIEAICEALIQISE